MQYDLGKKAIESSTTYMNAQLDKVNYGRIRKYFDISNKYLLDKMALVVFPFYYTDFSAENPGLYGPDLYIPFMSLISMVLLRGFSLGLQNRFHPEMLYFSFTRNVCFHAILCLCYKCIGYLFSVHVVYLDILALTGYKFFVVTFMLILKPFFLGRVLMIYPMVAFFFFLSRSLKGAFLGTGSSKKSMYLLFGVVALELLVTFWISQ